MKKLISIALLSAVAMLAAPKAANKTQNTNAPVTTTTKTKKVIKKKHHLRKAKAAVKTTAVAPAK